MRARLTLIAVRAGFGAILAVCVLVPVLFTRSTAETFMVPKLTVLWLGTLVAVVGVVTWTIAARRSPLPRLRVALPLGVLIALTALATLFSTSPVASFFGHYGRYDGLLGLVVGVVFAACVVAYCWREPGRLRWVLGAVVASAVVGLAYVTIQQFGWDWVVWLDEEGQPIPRPYGLLGNSNFSGAHLAIALPLVLALQSRVDGWRRVVLLALVPGLLLGVWWTGTRGGALAAVGGVAAVGALAPDLLPKFARWGAAALTALGLAFVLFSATADSVPGADRVREVRFFDTATLDTRVELWGAAVSMVGDHPLVGVGPDTFHLAYPTYRSPEAADNLVINADEAHNIILDRAATSGLPAALAYLWFVGLLAVVTARARTRLSDEHRWLLAGFGGAGAAYLLQGLVSIDVVPVALLGWVSAAALAALAEPAALAARASEAPAPPRLRPLSPVVLGVLALATFTLGLLAIRPFVADARYRDGIESSSAGRPLAEGAQAFEAAADWYPPEPLYHARFADQLVGMASQEAADDDLRLRLLREALLGYDLALDRDPDAIAWERAKARATVVIAGVDGPEHLLEADRIYRSLIERVDTDWQLFSEHGTLLATWARLPDPPPDRDLRAEAIDALERSVALFDESAATLATLAAVYEEDGRLADAREALAAAAELEPDRPDLEAELDRVEGELAGSG